MENSQQEENNNKQSIDTEISEDQIYKRVKATAIVTSILLALVVGLFPFLNHMITVFSWFYANLYHDCGFFCGYLTLGGWVVLLSFLILCGLLSSYIVKKIYRKTKKQSSFLNLFVVILSILIPFLLYLGMSYVSYYGSMPKTPIVFRCASVIFEGTTSFEYYGGAGKTGCIYDFAVKNKDISWCKTAGKIAYNARCVGLVAREVDDILLCNIISDNPTGYGGKKSDCIDVAKKQP